jgi:DNA-binding MarR family transcriptional regulator
MLKSLECSGTVERRRDPRDPRIMRVYLTREGVTREAEIASIWKRYQIETIGSLPEKDRRDFERLLDQFAERILVATADEVQST